MYEVEQKFHVDDVGHLSNALATLGATEGATESHRDTYYNHPCRDFAETREALRVRRVDDVPMLTYKGSLVPGEIKARQELEWRLDPGDDDGSKTESLLTLLGFRRVAVVAKKRRVFSLPDPWSEFTVVIDQVDSLGDFAEIELLVPDSDGIGPARDRIGELSGHLALRRGESRSYLTMILESINGPSDP